MNKPSPRSSLYPIILAVVASVSLSACTSLGYRCPLDPKEDAESPTACASMRESMDGAKRGTGGKISVLLDDQGRRVSQDMLDGKPATPVGIPAGPVEPYRNSSGQPVFEQPRVFQAWVPSFVDAEGNLHDGHHTWFSTPGRWSYGGTRNYGTTQDSMMRPAVPNERPSGKVISVDGKATAKKAAPEQKPSRDERDKAALNNLSNAANAMSAKPQGQQPAAPTGVTAPAVNLTE